MGPGRHNRGVDPLTLDQLVNLLEGSGGVPSWTHSRAKVSELTTRERWARSSPRTDELQFLAVAVDDGIQLYDL